MKQTKKINGKGLLHNDFVLEVKGKKEEDPSKFFNLLEYFEEFRNQTITFSVASEEELEGDE